MSGEAVEAIKNSDVIVGYKKYVELLEPLLEGQEIFINGMKKEVDRCRKALELSKLGKKVAMVSGGDAGIYGIGGIMQEIILEEGPETEVITIPGISSAHAAAAALGAPIVHDSCYISLSDLLTDVETIKKRLALAGEGDFVISLYNPKSKGRPHYVEMARDILLRYKKASTPVGIVKNARRENQEVFITTLEKMCDVAIDMSTMVIIGNNDTFVKGDKMITPRGYRR
jgi:precorrin-3B C17-methyltransferase